MGWQDYETETMVSHAIQERAVSENPDNGPQGSGVRDDGAAYTLEARNKVQAVAFAQNTRDEVRLISGDGQSVGALAAEPGTKQQAYVATVHGTQDPCVSDGAAFALSRNHGAENAVAFTASEQANSYAWERDHAPCLTSQQPSETSNIQTGVRIGMAVRRLTPRECERLQGFPDDFTRIPYRGKPADQYPDGPRYKALGNSMAVNVMRWIGERIQLVEGITKAQEQAA
jgi:DNA (cytosine-5)-methyltransferase 1